MRNRKAIYCILVFTHLLFYSNNSIARETATLQSMVVGSVEYVVLDHWSETRGVGNSSIDVNIYKLSQEQSGEKKTIVTDKSGNILSDLESRKFGIETESSDGKIHPRLLADFSDIEKKELNNENELTVIVWFSQDENSRKEIESTVLSETEDEESFEEGEMPVSKVNVAKKLALVHELEKQNKNRREVISNQFLVVSQTIVQQLNLPENKIVYYFKFAPAVAIKLTLEECQQIERSPLVNYILPDEQLEKELDVIIPSSKAPTVWDMGYTGSGVTIAHIETDRMETTNPYLSATAYRPAGSTDDHSTAIGGIIASTHSSNKGIAYGCNLLSANAISASETNLIAATDWAVTQGASILNLSMGLKTSSDGELHWSDIYYDYLVHYSRVLFTKSAGNQGGGTGVVTSPGRGYNSLAVGNIQGNETSTWSDDIMRSSSSHVDPVTSTEKPEVAAYGSHVDTTTTSAPWIGDAGSGTSYAAPLVAGIAGLCVDKSANLSDEPATLKAKLMVSGLAHNIEGDAKLSDYDGAGHVLATATASGSYSLTITESDFDGNDFFEIPVDISLNNRDPKRIVLAYTHPPSSQSATPDSSSYYKSDLDLYLYVNGTQEESSSYGSRNPFEIIDYIPSSSGTAKVKIKKFSWDPNVSSLRIGIAYASLSSLVADPDNFPWSLFLPAIYSSETTKSGVAGTWYRTWDWSCDGTTGSTTDTIKDDYTWSNTTNYSGTWDLSGNTFTYYYPGGTTYRGTVNSSYDKMTGTMTSHDGSTGCWWSDRIGNRTVQQILNEASKEQSNKPDDVSDDLRDEDYNKQT